MKLLYIILIPILFLLSSGSQDYSRILQQEWLLTIHPDYSIKQVSQKIYTDLGVRLESIKTISQKQHIYLVAYQGNLGEQLLKSKVYAHPMVKYFSKNRRVYLREKRPNDPNYDVSQWNMELIEAPTAWEFTTGGTTPNGDEIVIAVIDNAFELTHDDLRDNLWRFEDEIPNDGIDNDGNGFIDDYEGWDAKNGIGIRSQSKYHGTGVAGILGARGNNSLGVTGVNWNVKILPISIESITTVDAVLSAYNYVSTQRALYNETQGQKGAYIVVTNNSFGIDRTFPEEYPEWCAYYNTMGDLGILSVSATSNNRVDVDVVGDLPTNCDSKYLITVTSVGKEDQYSGLGFGAKSVDIAAPGNGTFTTAENNSFKILGSNSSASPHVAGTIALLYSLDCNLMGKLMKEDPESYMELMKSVIFEGADKKAELEEIIVTGGRLNIAGSMNILISRCDDIIENGDYALINIYPNPATQGMLFVEYQSPTIDPQEFVIYDNKGSLIYQVRHNPILSGKKVLALPDTQLPAGSYYIALITDAQPIVKSFVVLK